jgi:hypothetical protein
MDCPDMDRLMDLAREEREQREGEYGPHDPEDELLAHHLRTCPTCRAYLVLLRDLREALDPEVEVPGYLVDRVMASLPEADPQRPSPSSAFSPAPPPARSLSPLVSLTHFGTSAFLGAVTAGMAVLSTGIGAQGGPLSVLLFCGAAGGASVAAQWRWAGTGSRESQVMAE